MEKIIKKLIECQKMLEKNSKPYRIISETLDEIKKIKITENKIEIKQPVVFTNPKQSIELVDQLIKEEERKLQEMNKNKSSNPPANGITSRKEKILSEILKN